VKTILLAGLLASQVGSSTSSTVTSTIAVPLSPPPPPVEAPKPAIDPLGDLILYVGVPLLLPAPPEPAPVPPEPAPTLEPAPTPEPAPKVEPLLPLAPPPEPLPPPSGPPAATVSPKEEERPKPQWFIPESPLIERLRSIDGIAMTFAIVVLMVLAALLSSFVRRQNDGRTTLSRLASSSNKVLRVLAALLLLLLAIAWLPVDAIPFALLAAALALGWSLRDVLPDLIAGAVLAFERRVRPGMWLAGENFSGVVERVGLRATWLRDATDRRVAVPNRALVSNPVTSDDGRFPTREVIVRIETDASAEIVRRAIIDAVLASPWTPVSALPSVQRDGADPSTWHVRARVLDLSFAGSFEGELLERAEAMLASANGEKLEAEIKS
jgi:small-conductance mechanosensitive channel